MPNTLQTPTWIANEVGYRFVQSVKGVANFNRSYDDRFRVAGAKTGATIFGRKPVRFEERTGAAWSPQAIVEETFPVTLRYQKGVDLSWSTFQETTDLDHVRERYIQPAADLLAGIADRYGLEDVYSSVYNLVGTPGTVPTTNQTYLDAVTKIAEAGGDTTKLVGLITPTMQSKLVGANQALFHPNDTISKQYKSGQFSGQALGVNEWYVDSHLPAHTTGTFTSSTPLVNGASQTGSTLATDGWASGASSLKKGDKFTIAGVYSVDPTTKVSTGNLQDFVVTADTSDSAGAMATLPISPSIVTSGPRQTVSGSPANNAAINVYSSSGTYALTTTVSKQGLIFSPDFAVFVMADLAEPNGGANFGFARSKDFGISIRYARQWDITSDTNGSRLDIAFGAAVAEAAFATRVAS